MLPLLFTLASATPRCALELEGRGLAPLADLVPERHLRLRETMEDVRLGWLWHELYRLDTADPPWRGWATAPHPPARPARIPLELPPPLTGSVTLARGVGLDDEGWWCGPMALDEEPGRGLLALGDLPVTAELVVEGGVEVLRATAAADGLMLSGDVLEVGELRVYSGGPPRTATEAAELEAFLWRWGLVDTVGAPQDRPEPWRWD